MVEAFRPFPHILGQFIKDIVEVIHGKRTFDHRGSLCNDIIQNGREIAR